MRAMLLMFPLLISLSACQGDGTPVADDAGAGYGMSNIDPSAMQTEKAQCEARGGAFRSGGLAGLLTCFETPKDAGKSCSKSSDCSTGTCLARSRSCSPITPLYGCNALLDAEGRVVNLCVD